MNAKICPSCLRPLPLPQGRLICSACELPIKRRQGWTHGGDGRPRHKDCAAAKATAELNALTMELLEEA